MLLEAGADGVAVVADPAGVGVAIVVVEVADHRRPGANCRMFRRRVPSRYDTAAIAATTPNGATGRRSTTGR